MAIELENLSYWHYYLGYYNHLKKLCHSLF